MIAETAEAEVESEVRGRLGIITLDRPTALNALNLAMVERIIAAHAMAHPQSVLAVRKAEIARLFGGDDLDEVVAKIDVAASGADWIAEAQSEPRRASPTSLRATWCRMVDGNKHSIGRVLSDGYRMAVRMVDENDFAEGVRAILVDKNGAPRWHPSTLATVTDQRIGALLAPMTEGLDGEEALGFA